MVAKLEEGYEPTKQTEDRKFKAQTMVNPEEDERLREDCENQGFLAQRRFGQTPSESGNEQEEAKKSDHLLGVSQSSPKKT